MATVLITGGTGMIGTTLCKMLREKGYDVIILTRKPTNSKHPANPRESGKTGLTYAHWDIKAGTIEVEAIQRADHIVHLAGANVGEKRWTKKRKKEIVESRTHSAGLLVKYLKDTPNKVKTVISAAGIGWYGEDHRRAKSKAGFIETDPPVDDFLGQTCQQWERSIEPVSRLGKRLVIFRQGAVLDNHGGMLKEFRKPLYAGVVPILGNGKQIISWIHVQDMCRMYMFAMENEHVSGIYNAASNQPVSNKTLIMELAKRVCGKFCVPVYVPSFLLKLLFGELSIEVLKSTTVNNEKIRHEGFKFLFPSLDAALNQLRSGKK